MSDSDTYANKRARDGRVRVSAVGARCDQQFAMRGAKRAAAIGHRTATGPMPTVFATAVHGCTPQPAAIECHRRRPSEYLM